MFYRGSKSWLVWINLLLAAVALIPSVVRFFLWLLHATGGLMLGELAAFPAVLGAALLEAFGENWQIGVIPALFACLFVPILLRSSEIPTRIRVVVAAFVGVSLSTMAVEIALLHRAFMHGYFKGLFL